MTGIKDIGVMLTFILLSIIPNGSGYSAGAPDASCGNLYPKHHLVAQLTPPPYTLLLDKTQYSPGDSIQVTLQALYGTYFKGFIIVANRVSGDTEEIIGQFVTTPRGSKLYNWHPQQKEYKNCITHTSNIQRHNVSVVWQAPDWESMGDIVFRAGIVQDFEVFWVHMKSPVVTALVPPAASVFNSSVSVSFNKLDISGCGVTKGCMMFPRFCNEEDCLHVVTYQTVADGVLFEAKSKSVGYLSLGISRDKSMGDDETVTCIMKDQYVSVQHGYNPAYYNVRHRITSLTDIETAREGDYIYCRWKHPFINSFRQPDYSTFPPKVNVHTFNLRDSWYLQLASGHLYDGADVLGHHKELPLVSDRKVSLSQKTITYAHGLPVFLKIHALLGSTAWMLFAASAVVIARYYKSNVLKNKMKGMPAWFQFHRAFAIITVLLTSACVILIFAVLQKWSEYSTVHAVLGLVVTGLSLLQMVAGLCRPGLSHKYRYVFNWIHGLGGSTSILGSGACLIFSTYIQLLAKDLAWYLRIIIITWMLCQVFWIIVLEMVQCCTQNKYQVPEKPVPNGTFEMEIKKEEPGCCLSGCLGLCLFMYFLCNLVCTVAVNTFIFLY